MTSEKEFEKAKKAYLEACERFNEIVRRSSMEDFHKLGSKAALSAKRLAVTRTYTELVKIILGIRELTTLQMEYRYPDSNPNEEGSE